MALAIEDLKYKLSKREEEMTEIKSKEEEKDDEVSKITSRRTTTSHVCPLPN